MLAAEPRNAQMWMVLALNLLGLAGAAAGTSRTSMRIRLLWRPKLEACPHQIPPAARPEGPRTSDSDLRRQPMGEVLLGRPFQRVPGRRGNAKHARERVVMKSDKAGLGVTAREQHPSAQVVPFG
jgi:hypothetical protein